MPRSPRHRFANALRVVGATAALALVAGGPAVATAAWTTSAHQDLLQLIAANRPEPAAQSHVRSPDATPELQRLAGRTASVRTAVAVLAGTASPLPSEPVRTRTVIDVVVRTPADASPHPDQPLVHLDTTLVELQHALAGRDLSAGRRLVREAENAVLAAAAAIADDAVRTAAPDRAALPDPELVDGLDRAARLTQLAVAARSVEPSARYAAQARQLAADLRSAAGRTQDAGEPAPDPPRGARSTDGYANGMIPLEVLCPVPFAPAHRLRCDAADALDRLNAAFRAALGMNLTLSDSYRSLGGQVAVKAVKPALAASPGTSNHGWGLAVDLGGGVESYDSRPYAWLKEHAGEYGWRHPTYMDRGGAGPHEPWHWEFGTTVPHRSGTWPGHAQGHSPAPPPVTPLAAAPLTPSSSDAPVEPAPPVVLDAHLPAVQPSPPVEPSLPVPAPPDPPLDPAVPDEPVDVPPACEDLPTPVSPNIDPMPSETPLPADGASHPPCPPPADDPGPPSATDDPPQPPCPDQTDPGTDPATDDSRPLARAPGRAVRG